MEIPMRLSIVLIFLVLIPLAAQDGMIGFRGDGSGVFPGCTPPTEFDAITGKNLVWKMPLPNFSNSSPIAVGNKVFVTCADGWPEGQDCPQLLCYDGNTGKELWRRDLDEFATRPEAEAKEAKEIRKEYHQRIRRINTLMYEYQKADDTRKETILGEVKPIAGDQKRNFDRNSFGTGSAEQALFTVRDFAEKLRKICGYAPITWAPTCLDITMPTPVSDGKRVFVFTGRRSVHAFDLDGKVLWQVLQQDAPYNGHYPEDLANSPLIIGDLLVMYCFDHLWAWELDSGKLRWKAESKVPHRHGMGHPVRLNLPVAKGQTEPVLYLWTGDLVRLRDGKVLCRDVAPLSCASLSSDGVDRVFLGINGGGASEAKGAKRNWQFTGESQGGGLGVRFALSGDTATAEKLWFNAKNDGYKVLSHYPLYREGRLWLDSGIAVDASTGKVVMTSKIPQSKGIGSNGFILAGGNFIGVQEDGINEGSGGAGGLGVQKDRIQMVTVAKVGQDRLESVISCPVELLPATITEPSKRAQVIALTGLDRHRKWYGWSGSYGCPFASGNRLFIRTYNTLYCFGDLKEPFTPSKAFEERKP
jgi:outer membrane protein assembly factor BamB